MPPRCPHHMGAADATKPVRAVGKAVRPDQCRAKGVLACGHSAAHTAPRLMRERAHGRLTHTSALAVPPVVANGPQAVGLRDEPKARLCPT